LKDEKELLSFHQGEGFGALMHYVQVFNLLLNFVPMKKEYAPKVTFLHGPQPGACKLMLQRSEVSKTYQKLMKDVKHIENDFTFHKNSNGQSGHPKLQRQKFQV
jgi:hypothetical protein